MKININKIFYWILIFLAIFIPFREIISYITFSYIKLIPDFLIYITFLIYIINCKLKIKIEKIDILYFAFLLIGIISGLINDISIKGILIQFRSVSTIFILFYLLRNIKLNKNQYNTLLKILIIGFMILLFFGIIEYFTDKKILFPLEWKNNIIYSSNLLRVYTFMNNPNIFASYSLILFLIIYYMNDKMNIKYTKLIYFLIFLAILITSSRSSLLILGIFLIFELFISIKNKKIRQYIKIYNLIILSVLTICIFSFTKSLLINKPDNSNNNKEPAIVDNISIVERTEELTSGKTKEDSKYNGRIYKVLLGLKIFKNNPIIGTGFATYGGSGSLCVTPKQYNEYNIETDFYADNQYINILVETGALGALFFAIYIVLLLDKFWDSLPKVIIILSFLMIGMFYNVLELQNINMIMYFGLTFLNSLGKNEQKYNKAI